MTVNRACCAALFVVACGPRVLVGDEVGDDGSGEDTSGPTGGTTSGASTSGPVATGGTSGTGGTTVSTTSATTGTTGGSTCAQDSASGCYAYCGLLDACYPDEPGCTQACIEEMSQDTDPCKQAICEWYACLGALDCDSFESGDHDCGALELAIEEACPECIIGAGQGWCSYSCSNDLSLDLECGPTECTCFDDDVAVTTCEIANVCADPGDALPLVATECCGWGA